MNVFSPLCDEGTDEQILACLLEIAAGRMTSCSSSLIAAGWQQTRPTLPGPQTK